MANLESTNTTTNSGDPIVQQRSMGVLIFVIGLALSYFQIIRPLQAAANHTASSMTVSMKLAAIAPCALWFGLLFLIFPRFSQQHLGLNQSTPKTAIGWALMLIGVALGFVVWFWMQSQLKAMGYITSF